MPTRFRYTPVKPEAFTLTPVEILMATDKELNEYVSIKKYAPYRKDFSWDKDRNVKLRELKQRIAGRTGRAGMDAGDDGDVGGAKPPKKRKGRKERMKAKAAAEAVENAAEDEAPQLGKRKLDDQAEDQAGTKKRKRRHKKKPAI